MRSRFAYVAFLAPLISVAACTSILGDFSTSAGDDDGTGDGGNLGDATIGDGASNKDGSTITDGATSGDASDGAVLCGYAGEPCCTGPFSACVAGAACVSNECKVNDVWAVGTYGIFSTYGCSVHYDGTTWTRGPDIPLETSSALDTPYPASIAGFDPTDYRIAMAPGYIVEYQSSPQLWRYCSSSDAPCGYHNDSPVSQYSYVYGFGSDDFWVVGSNVMLHCTGAGSTGCAPTTTGLSGTWGGQLSGRSSKDLWLAGGTGGIKHYDGTTWSIPASGSIDSRAVWEFSPTDVWAGDGKLQHFDGTSWTPEYNVTLADGGAPGTIYSISGSASDDVWALGYNNANTVPFTLHWDGLKWTSIPIPAAAGQVQVVWAPAKDDAYIASIFLADGIYHWNGTAWSAPTLPQTFDAGAGFGGQSCSLNSVRGSVQPRPLP